MRSEYIKIKRDYGEMGCIVLKHNDSEEKVPGILWIHGGGYISGMAAMVYASCGKMLAEKYGGIVFSPEYRLSHTAPYPAALEDCYAALEYMWDNADEFGIDREHIIVGGESAGGGLCAALCIYARDKGKIHISMQIPLYPMIDCEDTSSSRDNHGKGWNTKKNHNGWSQYLGKLYGSDHVPPYASAAREKDLSNLPPCYTYVCDGEPFYQETLDFVKHLKEAGVKADVDVYHGDLHAFDLLRPWRKSSREAKHKLCSIYSSGEYFR